MRALALLPLLSLIACDAGPDTGGDAAGRLVQQPDPCLLTITRESVEFDIWDELSPTSELVVTGDAVGTTDFPSRELSFDDFTIVTSSVNPGFVLWEGDRLGFGFQVVALTDTGWERLEAGETLSGEVSLWFADCALADGYDACEDPNIEFEFALAVELEPAE